MLKIYSISLGCPKNRVDTERTLGRLGKSQAMDSPEGADLVFINTCGFIAPAIEETVKTIVETIDSISNLSGKRPFLAVAGCLVGRFGSKVLRPDLPEVDLFLEVPEVDTWAAQLGAALGLAITAPARLLSTPSYAWLKISDGCRHACTFCTIPQIRGKLHSTPSEVLLAEARDLLHTGVKELVVVAQDVTAYGSDKKEANALQHLLDKLFQLDGLTRLRLMYLYPAGLTKDFLGFLKGCGKPFVPYFDVPLQHAASNVLSRMGRPFAGNPYKAVDSIREFFPEAALRTSLITGFPGETPQDFDELCAFVEKARFHNLGVFAYQAEDGTPAASMPDQIAEAEKEVRQATIMQMQSEISEEILEQYLGSSQEIIVDAASEEWPGLYLGRTWFQAPEVDGLTYVSGRNVSVGAVLEADIMETKVYDLVALGEPE